MKDSDGTSGALTTPVRVAPLVAALRKRGLRVRLELDPTPTTWTDERHGAVTVTDPAGGVLAFDPTAQHTDADISAVRSRMWKLAEEAVAALPRDLRGGYHSSSTP
eukprot:TRINITY_DN16037_c0_g1_i1.p4 TRINITY_DN16037_c0_g1~~TRINITY_DN16037_c0_g1_i1.p4  ORF type:complete len:106 (+),score=31.32 TRINITY_DN16037_c0_g1_i1:303-620(+)